MTVIEGIKPGTWTIDPAHTDIDFSVRHLAIAKVKGGFGEFAGTIVVPENIEDTKVEVTIQVASISTQQPQRDGHLRTSDFFDADNFPTITFVSTSLTFDGSDFTLTGDLTLRGVTKSISLKGEFGGVTLDAYGNTKAGFEASTTINRKDYGVMWNAPTEAGGLTLGDDVKIIVDGQAGLEAPAQA